MNKKRVYKFWSKGSLPNGLKVKLSGYVVVPESDSATQNAAEDALSLVKDIYPDFIHEGTAGDCQTFPTVQLMRAATNRLNKQEAA